MIWETELGYNDRGGPGAVTAQLRLQADFTPRSFKAIGKTHRFVDADVEVEIADGLALVSELGERREVELPATYFTTSGYAPQTGCTTALHCCALPVSRRGSATEATDMTKGTGTAKNGQPR